MVVASAVAVVWLFRFWLLIVNRKIRTTWQIGSIVSVGHDALQYFILIPCIQSSNPGQLCFSFLLLAVDEKVQVQGKDFTEM